jgi:hypothetical protein
MNIYPVIATAMLLSLSPGVAHAQDPAVQHAYTPGQDHRAVLELTPVERAMILDEMHLFLSGLGELTGALGREDMPGAAKAARAMGLVMSREVPQALREKLPLDFRQRGSSVHRDFDQIALDADSLGDVSHSLSQLSTTLQKCAACHAIYQIRTPVLNLKP